MEYKEELKELEKQIGNLGTEHLSILIKLADSGKNYEYISVADGAACDLIHRKILYCPSAYRTPNSTRAYCLTKNAALIVHSEKFQELLLKNSLRKGGN